MDSTSDSDVDEYPATPPSQLGEETNKYRLELKRKMENELSDDESNYFSGDRLSKPKKRMRVIDSSTDEEEKEEEKKQENYDEKDSIQLDRGSEGGRGFPVPRTATKSMSSPDKTRQTLHNPFVLSQAQCDENPCDGCGTGDEESGGVSSCGHSLASFIDNNESGTLGESEYQMYVKSMRSSSSSLEVQSAATRPDAEFPLDYTSPERNRTEDSYTSFDSFFVDNDKVEYVRTGDFTQAMGQARINLSTKKTDNDDDAVERPQTRRETLRLQTLSKAEEMLGKLGTAKMLQRTVAACMNDSESSSDTDE